MFESFCHAKLKDSDISQLSTDGASNAIGSIAEYESLSHSSRDNDVDFVVCWAHHNEQSGWFASDMIKFANPMNEELGTVLYKSHANQVRLNGASSRMTVYRGIQEKKMSRVVPALNPKLSVKTRRWNSGIDEACRANQIMRGDFCETFEILLAKGGDDYDFLNKTEQDLCNLTCLHTPPKKI